MRELLDIGGHRRLHAPEGLGDPQLRKGGVDHGALATPKGAGGDKKGIAHEGFEGASHEVVFRVDVKGIGKNGAEQRRIVQDQNGPPGVAQGANGHAIGRGWHEAQKIPVAAPQGAKEPAEGAQGWGAGRFVAVFEHWRWAFSLGVAP